MSKILKNTTNAIISVLDTGIALPASPTVYEIPSAEYLLWANSTSIVTLINSGSVIVSDGINDLSASDAINYIKYPNFANSIRFLSTPEVSNGLSAKTVQTVVEALNERIQVLESLTTNANFDKVLLDDSNETLNDDEYNLLVED